TGP
ncbi:putative phage tail fiber protein, partial [Escherichia coli 96.0107]